MKNIDYTDIAIQISNWLQNASDEQALDMNDEVVKKAINIALYLHPKNEEDGQRTSSANGRRMQKNMDVST